MHARTHPHTHTQIGVIIIRLAEKQETKVGIERVIIKIHPSLLRGSNAGLYFAAVHDYLQFPGLEVEGY